MAKEITLPHLKGDILLIRLAREIAMDQFPVDEILARNGIKARDWLQIQKSPRFQHYLREETAQWNSALNTGERVKLKAAAMVEEWLPEAFTQMHNQEASLLHKTEVAKLVSRLGGMDKGAVGVEGGGEKFSVTINLGADTKLEYSKELPPRVIEGEKVDS